MCDIVEGLCEIHDDQICLLVTLCFSLNQVASSEASFFVKA